VKIAFACGHSNSCISVTAFEKAPGQLDPTLRSLRHERLGHYVPRSRLGDEVYRSIRRPSAASGAREPASNVRGTLESTGSHDRRLILS
jgi:hypothetical protein